MQAPDRHELNAGQTLPYVYGLDRLVLLPQTPHRLFAYWEITPLLWKNMHDRYQDLWATGQTVLRIINLDTGSLRQPAVDEKAGNWYVSEVEADRTYRAELGRILADGTYLPFLVSNTIRTPRASLAAAIDPKWRPFAFWQHRYYRRIPGGLSSAEFCCPVQESQIKGESS
ncbi:MAG: DUF4912 domain-containing protein [Bacillota bacterium]|nr:DUF4912 domain-containing protein [Bacillota bacterium]HHU29446.1 DUF4912 domain-containing protein [Bacillota bacterium]